MLWLLIACAPVERGPVLPRQQPLRSWLDTLELHPSERPPWPLDTPTRLDHRSGRRHATTVLLDGELHAPDCPPWPVPPLVQQGPRFVSARALPPIQQRLELVLDPAESLVHVERIIDTPQSGPSPGHWPAAWTLETIVDDVPTELPRDGDTVWWPPAERLVLLGDGPLPPTAHLDEQGLHLLVSDLVPDRHATSTGLAIIGSTLHLEPGRGQRTEGSDLVVSGVRFPHHASRDGVRVLANEAAGLTVLDRILASGVDLPRPLWVVPGPRDAYLGDHLVLGPAARHDDVALRRALWHLRDLEPDLRRAYQALEGAPEPAIDPGCFGLRSRPDLDRSALLAQVLLRDPSPAARSWSELEAAHPWLTAWLDAPHLPQLELRHTEGAWSVTDTRNLGLNLKVRLVVDGEPTLVGLDESLDGQLVTWASDFPLPAHRAL